MITGEGVAVVVRLFIDGEQAAEQEVWGVATVEDAALAVAERLLPVITAACRFLNTDAWTMGQAAMVTAIDAMALLPSWGLSGVRYLAAKGGGTDVVYDMPGRPQALRIVEDEFAEVLDADALFAWMEEKAAEDEDEDEDAGGDDDDG